MSSSITTTSTSTTSATSTEATSAAASKALLTTLFADEEEEDEEEVVYDQVDLDEMDFDEENETYYYPCPCGDRFFITIEQLEAGETIARCPSCSLIIEVLYAELDEDELEELEEKE